MLNFRADVQLGAGYKSAAQRTRVISEAWMAANGYCLACESDTLTRTAHNTRAKDFVCPSCEHAYELKSACGGFGARIVDGAHDSMMRAISQGVGSTLLLLEYNKHWDILGLSAIHRALLMPTAIERRKPLSASARRAGWVGCNILLNQIPPEGRITLIQSQQPRPKELCRALFQRAGSLSSLSATQRSWTAAVLLRLHHLQKTHFTLKDVYAQEAVFSELFPDNRHIREKLRQQLQVLRDAGYVHFLGNGSYSLIGTDMPKQRELRSVRIN